MVRNESSCLPKAPPSAVLSFSGVAILLTHSSGTQRVSPRGVRLKRGQITRGRDDHSRRSRGRGERIDGVGAGVKGHRRRCMESVELGIPFVSRNFFDKNAGPRLRGAHSSLILTWVNFVRGCSWNSIQKRRAHGRGRVCRNTAGARVVGHHRSSIGESPKSTVGQVAIVSSGKIANGTLGIKEFDTYFTRSTQETGGARKNPGEQISHFIDDRTRGRAYRRGDNSHTPQHISPSRSHSFHEWAFIPSSLHRPSIQIPFTLLLPLLPTVVIGGPGGGTICYGYRTPTLLSPFSPQVLA